MKITPESTRIGFIGLGVMGRSMAGHLTAGGYRVNAYTRTKSSADSLLERGAVWQENPGAVAEVSDVVITIVGYPEDVRQVYFGENGILNHMKSGGIVIDMTTSSPALAVEIAKKAGEKNISALDAPVSGGDVGAQEARLSIMVGGSQEIFDTALPLFQCMGKNIVFHGGPGSGQHCKMANQMAIACNMMGVVEAIRYGEKAGLDPKTVLQSIETGAAGSWSLSNLAPRMIQGDFDPGFFVKHFIKDMGIAVESCETLDLDAKGLALAKSLYEKLAEEGGEDDGTQALYKLYK